MPSCAVSVCNKKSNTSNLQKDGVTFHIFPKHPVIKKRWTQSCMRKQNWEPTRTSTICSLHFESSQFQCLPNKRRKLVHNAVPTLFLSNAFETNTATASLFNTEVKTERLEEPTSPVNSLSGKSDEPLKTERLIIIVNDPLSPKHCSSPSDTESNASTDGKCKKIKHKYLRKKLKDQEETCKGHINKIESLLKANRRLCQQNKNLKRILMTMKKKLKGLEEECRTKSEDEDSS